ncbi:hypothetical protein WA026_016120, partial [Henosepilachna vigintioctopunctata]
ELTIEMHVANLTNITRLRQRSHIPNWRSNPGFGRRTSSGYDFDIPGNRPSEKWANVD